MEVSTEPGRIDHVPPMDDDDFDYELDDGRDDHKDVLDFEINGADADADADPGAETGGSVTQADVSYDAVEAYDDAANEEDVKSPEMVSAEGLAGEMSHSNDGGDAPASVDAGAATQPQDGWQQDDHDVAGGQGDNEIDYEDEDDYPVESHEGQPKVPQAGGEVAHEIEAYEDVEATEHASLDDTLDDTAHPDESNLVGADAAQAEYADELGLVETEAGGEEYHNASNDADPSAGWDEEPDYSGATEASGEAGAVPLDDANADDEEQGSNDPGVSSSRARAATEDVLQNEDVDGTAASWEEGGEVQAHEGQDFSAQPDVKVIYRDEEYSLLAESSEDDPISYFLADAAALDAPLTKFLASVRQVIAGELSQADEIVMRVDGLGLEFGETTTTDFLGLTTFRQLLELHNKLVQADDPTASHTLYVFLVTRRSCLQRFTELVNGVNEGKGLAEIGAFFNNAQPFDPSPDESGDEDVSLDASAEEEQYDDMDIQEPYGDVNTADAAEQEQELEADSAFAQPDTGEEADADAAHVEIPRDAAEGEDEPAPSDAVGRAADLQMDSAMHYALAEEVAEPGAQSPSGITQVLEPTVEVPQVDEHGEEAAGVEEELLDYDTNEELDDPSGKPSQSSDDHVQQKSAESTAPEFEDGVHGDHHDEPADAHGDDEGYLDLHDYTEVNEDGTSLDEVVQIPTGLTPHPSTPPAASENTSATATLDGVEIDYEDDVALVHGEMSTGGNAEPSTGGPDDGHGESSVNEIDWDHDDDDVVQHDDTNLTPSSLSAKRSRQADEGDDSGDENAAKRQRT